MSTARRVGPADWLVVADRDLSVIRLCLAATPPLVLPALYNCQQAAEKLVKAVLVAEGVDVPKTHDIDRLVMLVPAAVPIRERLVPLARFTAFAAAYRYPGEAMDFSDDPTAGELASWLAELEAVQAEVIRFIGS